MSAERTTSVWSSKYRFERKAFRPMIVRDYDPYGVERRAGRPTVLRRCAAVRRDEAAAICGWRASR
ncbi:hypothetical protein JM78_08060 [Burkholderia pyrrocinia]|nr:hypothetical protein JM78_08060 [Burkholderia pyrrocinia]